MYVGYALDYNTVLGLRLDVELCPETGNSYSCYKIMVLRIV